MLTPSKLPHMRRLDPADVVGVVGTSNWSLHQLSLSLFVVLERLQRRFLCLALT